MSACRFEPDHGVDRLRLQHHARRHGVDQLAVPRDLGEFARGLGGDLVPQHHAVALRVRLRHDGQVPARARAREREGKAHDAADAGAGEDRGLGRDLFRVAPVRAPAVAGIFALAVLAHDDPVDAAGRDGAKRRLDPRQEPRRAHIGVLVEALADGEAQAPQGQVVGQIGVADGAEEDRIEAFEILDAVLGHHAALGAVIVRAPRQGLDAKLEAGARGHGFEHLDPGRDHFLADAVARDRRDAIGGQRVSAARCGGAAGAPARAG